MLTAAAELEVGPLPPILREDGLPPLDEEYNRGEVWNRLEPYRSEGAGVDVPPLVMSSLSSSAEGVLGTGRILGWFAFSLGLMGDSSMCLRSSIALEVFSRRFLGSSIIWGCSI